MKIPESFNCAGFNIKVKIVDTLENNEYGIFNDATNEIIIANYVFAREEKTELSEQHKFNTFLHELIHVWQFYYDNTFIEAQAQVFANFAQEFLKTKN